MYKLLICLLVFSGIVFMVLGILKFRSNIRLMREFYGSDDLSISHSLAFHQSLLFLFLFGYIIILFAYMFNISLGSEMITGLIFFFGAVFVFIENNLHKKIVSSLKKNFDKTLQISVELKEEREKLLLLNKILKTKVYDLHKSESKRHKLEAQLQQVQKMEAIGTLAGGIAHDFNNTLAPIMGHCELLLMDIPKDSPFRGNLEKIFTSASRARDLVKQILTFSRQENKELKLMKMQPIVKEVLKLIRSTIPATIEIKHDIDVDCGAIKADLTQIHQLVMNLTTNAYHAMEDTGGELRVSLKEIESAKIDLLTPDMESGIYVCLTIADTGIGMDQELTKKIFDPFFTTKDHGKGTGMGLSIVYGIVNSLGGTIRLNSEPGHGSEFKVYFPVDKTISKEQIIQQNDLIQGGKEHVFFVDDEDAILNLARLVLEPLGYQVTTHSSSIEALEDFRVNSGIFDIVITDLAMPKMTGDKLVVELIKIRPDIPIMLCTGFSESMSEEKALSIGIKSFLLKPIALKDLTQKIRSLLDENIKLPKER